MSASRLRDLQAAIDDPGTILSDAQIGEYLELTEKARQRAQEAERQKAQIKAAARAAEQAEQNRLNALRGKSRIRNALGD